MASVFHYRIRSALPKDGPEFLRLVAELARFEKLKPPTPTSRRRLIRDAFGPEPRYELYVVDAPDRAALVAYAIVLKTYSSFLGKPTLYLEDLYVSPTHREMGIGRELLGFLARLALERGCGRLEGVVLSWNKRARRFYDRLGANEMRDWILFRFDERTLRAVASPKPLR